MIYPTQNNFPTQSITTQPRGLVKVNGTLVDFLTLEVNNNTNYQADMFRVELPVNTLPSICSISNMIGAGNLQVEVFMGLPSNPNAVSTSSLTSWILGNTDDLSYDPCSQLVILSGRDLTSLFQDTKISSMYPNLTSSDIATMLAQNEGLTPVVQETSTQVGLYYQIDNVNINKSISEWDLLTYLATREQFACYVKGNYLYFMPANTNQTPYIINSQSNNTNVIDLKLSHNKLLARDVKVKVSSWNLQQQKAFTVTATATHTRGTLNAGASPNAGLPQQYVYTFANLTQQQAQNKATSIAQLITQHELRLNATLTGNDTLTTQSTINLRGTNTDYDQTYFPSSISRRLSIEEGYTMEIIAKNHATDSQVTI